MEFEEFVKKKHWYTSVWADIIYVAIGVLALLFIFGTQYATGELGFSVNLEKARVKPGESVFVDFNQPMATSAIEKNFEISPSSKVSFAWTDNFRKMEIRPAEFFEPGKSYTLKIDPRTDFSLSNLLGKESEPAILSFEVEADPKVIQMIPASGDPNVKIDSAIKISFDKPTTGYDVTFVVEPFKNFDLSLNESKKDFTIQSKDKFGYAVDYAVSVKLALSAAKLSAKDMPEIYRANFKTESEPVVVPDPVPNANVPSEPIEAKITEGKYIDINLAKQNLSTFENGKILGTYKVSSGKKGMATPTGTFKVISKTPRAYSKKYKLFMPYWMQFTGAGHGIHELPEWPNGYKEGANHLSIPVSHGCVRLGVGPAAKVYNWSDIGTPIVIHY